MSTQKLEPETVMLPWKKIHVPEERDRQVKTTDAKTKELAEELKEHGQVVPIIVYNGGSGDQPYTLAAGARRMAAFEVNGWTGREIRCEVHTFKKGDFLGPLALNWIENQREDVSFVDQATWVHKLVNGTYVVPEGEEAVAFDKKVICERFGITSNYMNKMLKSMERIEPAVARRAKQVDAPARLVIALSQVKGTGRTEEQKEETRVAKQIEMVDQYKKEKDDLEQQGRTRGLRKERRAKKPKKVASEAAGEIRPSRSLDDDGRTASDYLQVLDVKRSEGAAADKAFYNGQFEMLAWLTAYKGKKKCSGVGKPDFKFLDVKPKSDEE